MKSSSTATCTDADLMVCFHDRGAGRVPRTRGPVHRSPEVLETLRRAAIVQSVESPNRIEGDRRRRPIDHRAEAKPRDRPSRR